MSFLTDFRPSESPIYIEGNERANSPSCAIDLDCPDTEESSFDAALDLTSRDDVPSNERLISIFDGHLSPSQVTAVYEASGKSFHTSMDCLLNGPTTESLVTMLNGKMRVAGTVKLRVDPDDVWQDLLVHYKSPNLDLSMQLCIKLQNAPAIDTGGVRRQIFTSVFGDFASNMHVRLFDGPSNSLRPVCTAESRSCGLFRVLGTMIGHSICLDGIGFPYLSAASYWYMVGGEERAMEFVSLDDVGADVASVVFKVF